MAVISACDSDSVTDDCLDHKSVLKVTDAVTLPRLAPFDTCKKREDAFKKKKNLPSTETTDAACTAAVPTV